MSFGAQDFAQALSTTLPDAFPRGSDLWGGAWTQWMFDHLHRLAVAEGFGCCCKDARHPTKWNPRKPEKGLRREYLFDLTWYRTWNEWAQPEVIIEHENLWSEKEFLVDHWKLTLGYAPLRVSFGYARRAGLVDGFVTALMKAAEKGGWNHPAEAEDLVLIGHGGMQTPRDFVLLHRPRRTKEYRPAGTMTAPMLE